jgi:hypothetical protein
MLAVLLDLEFKTQNSPNISDVLVGIAIGAGHNALVEFES